MAADWNFAPHQPGDQLYNPLMGEVFEDWEAGESLVRECIQNSLDARADNETVSVLFQLSSAAAMSAETARFWFGSLWPHLRAKECKLAGISAQPRAGGFIVVEDFGTRGLEGDLRQWGIGNEPENNDFFSFFRAEGLSGKTANSGGAWGAGKSVFHRASEINSFLAVTVRRRERDVALIGKSLLRHHILDEQEYQAVGQYGALDSQHKRLVMPATERDLLKRLARDFKLRRPMALVGEGEPEPGLSVIVPYADREVSAKGLLSIVIREYFQPILAGRLSVRVSGEGLPGGTVTLDSDSIQKEATALNRPEIEQLLKLAEWARDDGIPAAITINEPLADQGPRWDDSLFPADAPAFKEACERFDLGEPVAFHVPLRVYPTDEGSKRTWFGVFLKRDMDGPGYKPVYVRAGIVVPNARDRAVRGQSLFALVTIDDQPLALMLRAAEPPAHTKWVADTANFRGRYDHGKATIDFVVSAPKFIADALSSAHTKQDVLALADFFPEPDDAGREAEKGGARRKGRSTQKPPPPPPPRSKPFRIEELRGGFKVVRDNSGSTQLPGALEVLVAYETRRGNALNKYQPWDFSLRALKPRLSGGRELECADNRMVISPTEDEFSLEVTGFDENRDLFIKVRTVEPPVQGGEA